MEKIAVYTGNAAVYHQMYTAVKSLLKYSDVDKVYFLIEDDQFPYELPPCIECINISNLPYFSGNSANVKNSWGRIVLSRVAYSKILPQHDKILSLDVDTMVMDNISELWDIDLDGYYYAGVRDMPLARTRFYMNVGVMLCNLKLLRETHMDDKLIENLTNINYHYPEQDCINSLCAGHLLEISPDYNIGDLTNFAKVKHRKILHQAGMPVKYRSNFPEWKYLETMEMPQQALNLSNKIKLDIIIPTYKNKKGLRKTLQSINWSLDSMITVTVVDDASELDYSDIQEEFPLINIIYISENSGPGYARQVGIENTTGSHIMFIDTGDYFLSKFNLIEILATLHEYTLPYVYNWGFIHEEENNKYVNDTNMLHGKVYERHFLEITGIKFCLEMSYANEDIGFNRAINLILHDFYIKCFWVPFKQNYIQPIYWYNNDEDSITRKNEHEFKYTTLIKGLTKNIAHVIHIAEKNSVLNTVIYEELNFIINALYYYFLRIAAYWPEHLEENWHWLHEFYINVYSKYIAALDDSSFSMSQSTYIKTIRQLPLKIPINFRRFIAELKEEKMPERYYTAQ